MQRVHAGSLVVLAVLAFAACGDERLEPLGDAHGWLAVSTGAHHTCAVRDDHTLWCWGKNLPGSTPSSTRPSQVDASGDWAAVATAITSGAIKADGSAWVWHRFSTFTPFDEGTHWLQIDADSESICALRDDHSLWCKGNNYYGQFGSCGYGPTPFELVFQESTGSKWARVAAGGVHTCAVRIDGTLWCWGQDKYGALGDGYDPPVPDVNNEMIKACPVRVGTASDWLDVAAGFHTSCGIRAPGTLWCWGRFLVDDGEFAFLHEPQQVGNAADWWKISLDGIHGCGLKRHQSLWCWGSNMFGGLGTGIPEDAPLPVRLPGRWRDVGTSRSTCGVRTDRSLWCWGEGQDGELGLGEITSANLPTKVVVE